SKHWHGVESLAAYEDSLWAWFRQQVLTGAAGERSRAARMRFLALTPQAAEAPHSSLVHMLDAVARRAGFREVTWAGQVGEDGGWAVSFAQATSALAGAEQAGEPLLVPGTAFSFVH